MSFPRSAYIAPPSPDGYAFHLVLFGILFHQVISCSCFAVSLLCGFFVCSTRRNSKACWTQPRRDRSASSWPSQNYPSTSAATPSLQVFTCHKFSADTTQSAEYVMRIPILDMNDISPPFSCAHNNARTRYLKHALGHRTSLTSLPLDVFLSSSLNLCFAFPLFIDQIRLSISSRISLKKKTSITSRPSRASRSLRPQLPALLCRKSSVCWVIFCSLKLRPKWLPRMMRLNLRSKRMSR